MGDVNLEKNTNPTAAEKFSTEQKPQAEHISREQSVEHTNNKERNPTAKQVETDKPRLHLPSLKKSRPTVITPKDSITVQIENIMQDGLTEAYQSLSPIAQQEFKIKGEETANNIRELLKSTHVKVKKVFQLIYEWLRILPGINRFFLEQEAKIKTDQIISIKKEQDQGKIEQI